MARTVEYFNLRLAAHFKSLNTDSDKLEMMQTGPRKKLVGIFSAIIGLAIVKIIAGTFLDGSKTYASYTAELLQGDNVDKVAQGYVGAVLKDQKPEDFDVDGMKNAVAVCLRRRLQEFLNSGDPRLRTKITKADVLGFSRPLIEGCANEIASRK